MPEHPYLPGKAIILSRLPAQDWFTIDEAAEYSGWGRTFVRSHVVSGELPAQQGTGCDARYRAKNSSYRIHIDDLVFFIIRNGNGHYTEEKPFRDVISIIRSWPVWMIRELQKALNRLFPTLTPSAEQAAKPTTDDTN